MVASCLAGGFVLSDPTPSKGALAGLRVLDLTRILAGPSCTQVLGDLGADVIKIERPGKGDDTRGWGPPYVKDAEGQETRESAYYMAANRNKRSVTIDISQPEGQGLIRRLAAESDIVVENFKVGGLKKYGLDYASLAEMKPGIIYCSITGFGQTGPYAPRAGYDFLAQGLGGIMSLTGAPDGEPMKVGVGISDVMCGMYGAISILAALHHRDKTGIGQHIDLSLLDVQVSWLVNEGCNYLLSGKIPKRQGNAHPNIVPYQVFKTADGHFILAVGNDEQFRRFCDFAGLGALAEDDRYQTNSQRIINRESLIPILQDKLATETSRHWLAGMEKIGVPAGAINTMDQVFEDKQVQQRQMKITMDHPLSDKGTVDLIGSPIKMSETPVDYAKAPPTLGQHTEEVLQEVLGLDQTSIAALKDKKLI